MPELPLRIFHHLKHAALSRNFEQVKIHLSRTTVEEFSYLSVEDDVLFLKLIDAIIIFYSTRNVQRVYDEEEDDDEQVSVLIQYD